MKQVEIYLLSVPGGTALVVDDERVAGGKPWGGGQIIATHMVSVGTLQRILSRVDMRPTDEEEE